MVSVYAAFGKRVLDIFASTLSLFIFSPVLLLTSIFIRLEDNGPAFFRQERVGRGRKGFSIYKFRSMPLNAPNVPSAEATKIKVTAIGRIIRRTNVDELPQLINVLQGDMSLIGPRPALFAQEKLLALRSEAGADMCRPGMTGLAQVNSYDGMSEEEKANWDGQYARNITLWNDMKIILRTFGYLMKRPPVY